MAGQMEMDVDQEEPERPMKSLNSDKSCHVTFTSRTRRKVDVFWLDFKGNRVLYRSLNHIGGQCAMQTFETHPWVFRDGDTGDLLVANNREEVYYPSPWPADQPQDVRRIVNIDIPVYSLHERCLQIVRKYHTAEEIKEFEAPRILKADLLHRENISHTFYEGYKGVN